MTDCWCCGVNVLRLEFIVTQPGTGIDNIFLCPDCAGRIKKAIAELRDNYPMDEIGADFMEGNL